MDLLKNYKEADIEFVKSLEFFKDGFDFYAAEFIESTLGIPYEELESHRDGMFKIISTKIKLEVSVSKDYEYTILEIFTAEEAGCYLFKGDFKDFCNDLSGEVKFKEVRYL